MKVAEGNGTWKVLSIIAFIISSIVLGIGLDKMFNYDSGEYFPYEYHNAYVGGDAYNYIINGNYATEFFVLSTMFALMGVGFIILYYLSKIESQQEKLLSASLTMDNVECLEEIEGDNSAPDSITMEMDTKH